ncbi:post-GPI attachment to proteins factor 6 [Euwallacea similis]|uniref:post-GPI attachment to proteins factor 6 n=1 Tax=Euwallacea similis TaxID=1736056 RepID=UPI00345073C8
MVKLLWSKMWNIKLWIELSIISILPLVYSLIQDDLQLISMTHSSSLEKYLTYSHSVIMHFEIPQNTIFASFVFVALEQDLSIFGCSTRNVSLYLKHASIPLVNPDGTKVPKEFKEIIRPAIHNIEFLTDQKKSYINITSPDPGIYYAATFLAYEDPRYGKISQQGLSQSCEASVDASVYVSKIEPPFIITDNVLVNVVGQKSDIQYFRFLIPRDLDHVILNIPQSSNQILLRVGSGKPPTSKVFLLEKTINFSSQIIFAVQPQTWYYLSFDFQSKTELNFRVRYLSNMVSSGQNYIAQSLGNVTLYNMSVVTKTYLTHILTNNEQYVRYPLLREALTESYMFSYKLQPEMGNTMFIPVNVTSKEFSVLQFHIQKGSDIGGTLQYILAFKPRVSRSSHWIQILKEPENHIVIGCIQRNAIAVPTWPKNCVSSQTTSVSPLILNETTTNSTLLIPYPESGVWYASFKLFCGKCQPCNCPESCKQEYEGCVVNCELNCTDGCEDCQKSCKNTVLSKETCKQCDCDGPCLRNSSNVCNTSIVFDVSSKPCYFGSCGSQGRCGLFISEGVAYSSCLCSNNYRGFDCSDDSLATPYYLVLLEFLFLIISNILFIPAVYIAYKRKYYLEALLYFSIFLSSSFYHACDAGENILSFCVFRLAALQFADFFSALLAIWLTLLVMADLPPLQLSLLQMSGAMIISFCVTLNRYALWIFALPSAIGVVIIGISWYLKYRKFRCRFIDRGYLYVYLPVGSLVVFVGLIIYALLQTQRNYMYLHSLWHMIMAAGVCLLLPKPNTFQAAVLL